MKTWHMLRCCKQLKLSSHPLRIGTALEVRRSPCKIWDGLLSLQRDELAVKTDECAVDTLHCSYSAHDLGGLSIRLR